MLSLAVIVGNLFLVEPAGANARACDLPAASLRCGMVTVAARILGFAAAAWFAVVCPARACDLPAAETGTVASVIDGETLKLTDGRTVRLIGAKAPMPPLGWRGEDPWPFVDEAKRWRRWPQTGRWS